jgi:hypothetical protein
MFPTLILLKLFTLPSNEFTVLVVVVFKFKSRSTPEAKALISVLVVVVVFKFKFIELILAIDEGIVGGCMLGENMVEEEGVWKGKPLLIVLSDRRRGLVACINKLVVGKLFWFLSSGGGSLAFVIDVIEGREEEGLKVLVRLANMVGTLLGGVGEMVRLVGRGTSPARSGYLLVFIANYHHTPLSTFSPLLSPRGGWKGKRCWLPSAAFSDQHLLTRKRRPFKQTLVWKSNKR